ncbi:glutathione S-transferase [Fusarium proliferatum]|uniref:GST N-terminal domain-containing protein n=1 Tax=Gibberella intermedia TaxID=948311 RepID=A0A420RU08_GIBIN|nr:glutathione S-transferase [Fusarium proliferatum]KAG4276877.1 glutathione S-transferase [Fusarium proliferatum]RKL20541.1 hypothetical protein BFJ72_g15026 [Fusarium proliferatum]
MSFRQTHQGPEDAWHGIIEAHGQFPPEQGRYHLYIGLFCPFAHRVNIVRHLRGLESVIDASIVRPFPKGDENGWPGLQFLGDDPYEGATKDKVHGLKHLHELYFKADPNYKGKYSVPVLWDTKEDTIVSNESAEMLRWLPSAFTDSSPERECSLDLYPAHLQTIIDSISVWMQRDLNVRVYKAGFSTTQTAYEDNVTTVFAALNHLEKLLHQHGGPYILGSSLTEVDVRAFPTVIRFDTLYVQHCKCNLGTIRGSYPIIHEWMKNLYWNVYGFQETTNFQHIKDFYIKNQGNINPLGIVPIGPFPDVEAGAQGDFSALQPGEIRHAAVLRREEELYG